MAWDYGIVELGSFSITLDGFGRGSIWLKRLRLQLVRSDFTCKQWRRKSDYADASMGSHWSENKRMFVAHGLLLVQGQYFQLAVPGLMLMIEKWGNFDSIIIGCGGRRPHYQIHITAVVQPFGLHI